MNLKKVSFENAVTDEVASKRKGGEMTKTEKIAFFDDELVVVKKNEKILVALKPICVAMGLDWASQHRLIKEDLVLISVVCITQITGADGKQYEMLCLPLDYLNGWLFKISAKRYTGPRREAIIRYQKECYHVLAGHFLPQSSSQSPYGSKGGACSAAASDASDALPAALPGWDAEAVSALQAVVEARVSEETANLRYLLRLWCYRLGVDSLDELQAIAWSAFEICDFEQLWGPQITKVWGFPPFHPATRRRVVARMAAPPSQSSQSPFGCRGEGIGDDKP